MKAVVQRCSVKKVLLEISQNSQENTCARFRPATLLKKTLAQVFPCEFCVSKNNFFFRTPLVAASENSETLKYCNINSETRNSVTPISATLNRNMRKATSNNEH